MIQRDRDGRHTSVGHSSLSNRRDTQMVRTWIETPNNAGTGPSEQWYADDTNSYNWRTIDVHRDDHRQTTGWDINFDDGSSEKVLVDNNNKDTWSWLDVHFNSDGKRTESTVMNDDGTF